MLTEEQKVELKTILSAEVLERVNEAMAKVSERKIIPGTEVGIPSESKWKSFGEFLYGTKRNPGDARLKSLIEGVDSSGGYLVPEEFRNQLFIQRIERSVVRPYATVVQMASDTLNWPAIDDSSHASTRYGGSLAYWTEEAGSKTASYPTFRQIKLIAHKLTAYTYASDELLADNAVALETLLKQLFTDELAWREDYDFLRGDGVGKPHGIFASGACLSINRGSTTAVTLADLGNIMGRLYPTSLYAPSTVWIISPAVLTQLIQLSTTPITWLPSSGGAAGRIPATILGMPFFVTEKVPTLGSAGDIGLYDLSYYVIADRGDLRIDSSEHVRFTTDETVWRFVERVDGQSMVDSAFTPNNGGSTLSPFVQLYSATTGGE